MPKETITLDKFLELANEAISQHDHFQQGMQISFGLALPGGVRSLVYKDAGTKKIFREIRGDILKEYIVDPMFIP